ncbi:Hsp20/alpha crystallin family protein [Halorubrum sp. Atlit-26R]|uniref:Hsp20/alpha crystallin family protein n=1 Tax=Halorubrum sp. Atlit-26R TaxID=2282128 RepID=UPI000EF237F1|nr:Hsp20/alpha crystallin family protein [Halorubrum sp. Atlit-26R]RLM64164.1 Hsp20/alpha crystallin family protein [Halorubrum sp. Atlit-26R]
MSSRYDPFAETERLLDRMNRRFGDVEGWDASDDRSSSTPIDLVEHDDEFVVTFDLPGFETDDVEVRVADHTLRIEADRDESVSEDDEAYIRRERRHRSVRESVSLPDEVDTEAVSARMRNGVLTVTLPRTTAEAERTVEINEE